MSRFLYLATLLAITASTIAAELNVPSQYTTIQSAIEAAVDGDTVIVAPGSYRESVDFKGKALNLRSEHPLSWETVSQTIIYTSYSGSCVKFATNEGPQSILEGFTLSQGRGTDDQEHYGNIGGGIYCKNSSPTIRYCNIIKNGDESTGRGAGIALVDQSSALVENCFITNNHSFNAGGAVFVNRSEPSIVNCTIADNISDSYSCQVFFEYSSPNITGSIIYGGSGGILCRQSQSLTGIKYCCVEVVEKDPYTLYDHLASGDNISVNPRFISPQSDIDSSEAGNYHLQYDSPCVNMGDPELLSNETDIDGEPRINAGRVDIGADEVTALIVLNSSAGNIWASGSTHAIRWQSYGFIGNVKITFTDDGGTTWQTIADDIADTGSHRWLVPDSIDSNLCIITISAQEYDEPIRYVDSGIFSIHPSEGDTPVDSPWSTLGKGAGRTGQALAAATELGCVKWNYNTQGEVHQSVTIGADNNIHISCEDGKLYTIDQNGTEVWTYNAGSEISSAPTVGSDGTIYFGCRDGKLHAVDKDGGVRWTHSTGEMIFSSPGVDGEGNVFVGSQNGSVYAFGSDGSELWDFATKGPGVLTGSVLASPTIGSDGTVYIGGLYDATLYSLNPADGEVKWTASFTEGTGFFVSPVVGQDGIIYVSLQGSAELHAVDPADGQITDTIDMLDIPIITDPETSEEYFNKFAEAQCFTEPAVAADGTIYVSLSDPYLRAFNSDGSLEWVTRLGMTGGFTLAIGNDGLIYAASDDRTLYVVSPGGELLSVFTGDRFLSFPVIADDGTIYVSDSGNSVWAIGALPCDDDGVDLHRIEDVSGDGIVNLIDLSLIAADWLNCNEPGESAGCDSNGIEPRYLAGDIDRNLYVNFKDIQQLAQNWLTTD